MSFLEGLAMSFGKAKIRTAGRVTLAVAALVVLAGQPLRASSPDAWDELREKVAKECLALALAGDFEKATAQVDPFGTESYGLALVKGTLKKGAGEASSLCVLDKKSGKAELGGESSNWVTLPAPAKAK